MNPDLERGTLFRYRAKELLDYLKAQPEKPYRGTQVDLAKALFIGERTIGRYLRYLQGTGKIEMQHTQHPVAGTWVHYRKIVLLEE